MNRFPNRIVGAAEVEAEQLLANPMNWRIHPHYQHDALEKVLDDIGWVAPVIVNQETGHLIDGHLRVLIALNKGSDEKLPVLYVSLTAEEERTILATLDPLGELAVADKQQLAILLNDIEPESEIIADLLTTIAKTNRVKFDTTTKKPSIDRQPQMHVCVCKACGNQHYEIKTPGGGHASKKENRN